MTAALLLAALALGARAQDARPRENTRAAQPQGEQPSASPRPAEERLVLRTVGGDVVLGLYPDAAPEYVARLRRLVGLGAYDATHFSRVVPGSHVQLSPVTDRGLPLSPGQRAALGRVPDEYTDLVPRRGDLFLARDRSRPDKSKTSFAIILADGPSRPGRYAVFGRVESGMDVLDGFAAVPRDALGRPAARLEVLGADLLKPAELATRRLAPARPVARIETASVRLLAAGLAVVTALVACAWLARRRLPRTAASLELIAVLGGVFALVTVAMPAAPLDPVFAVGLFAAILGVLKLMSRFES